MSFFKKIKDKVTGPKANISLKFNKDNFVLGEDIEGTLTVASEEEFDTIEIRFEIQCVEEAKKIKRMYDERVRREIETESWESATLYSARTTVSGPLHITRGYTRSFPFSINIPLSGRPTYKSIDRKVAWSIKGVIAVDGRPDVTSRTIEIQVAQSATSIIKEREVIREVIMIPCKYCEALMPQTATACPNCGARRTV
ncbi:MAG: hypothetical protein ACUVWK_01235 [Nitrososphaerales archaeon]